MRQRDDRKKYTRQRAAAAMLLLLGAARPACAQPATVPHVRGDAEMQRLIDEASRRAPAIRDSIARLQALDVTVYVRTRTFAQTDLEGRVALLSTVGRHRYLVIELACGRTDLARMATLGHELFHAIEIAQEPSIVDSQSLATFYTRVGIRTSDGKGQQTFETEAAAAAGLRARRQLHSSTRDGHGT